MYAIGIVSSKSEVSGEKQVSLFIYDTWRIFKLKNTIPKNFPEWGIFHYHENSDECFWINPVTIIERATFV